MGLKLRYDEGQTPLNDEEREGLKLASITTQNELNEFEQLNIEKAILWSMKQRLTKEKVLSDLFIKSLHKKMFGDIWSWAGNFRKSDKKIGVSWLLIPNELKYLLDAALFWINNKSFSSSEIAIRFKHRLVSIHCFPNGNGRHSRLMADIVMEHIFREAPFGWHGSHLANAHDIRKKYISALKKADDGDVCPLLDFAKN